MLPNYHTCEKAPSKQQHSGVCVACIEEQDCYVPQCPLDRTDWKEFPSKEK